MIVTEGITNEAARLVQNGSPCSYTYSGRKVGIGIGSPTIFDVAIALARECRYACNGLRWYPVALHTFVVCDMLPQPLKLHGLLHDGTESITGDLPRPYKTDAFIRMEHKLHRQFYTDWGLPYPTKAEYTIVKRADNNALFGEVHTIGSYGLQELYPERCKQAEDLTMLYIEKYPPMECLVPSGLAVVEFMRRYHEYKEYL
jgi:hypothetical protein